MLEPPVRLGIDIGGTFTDLVAEGANGRIDVEKVSSTPEEPTTGVIRAVEAYIEDAPFEMADVTGFFHGSTVTTNAIIERDGARTGLLLTDGYDAIPVVGEQARPKAHVVNPFYTEADDRFLVPSARIETVPERLDEQGEVREPLDREAVQDAVARLHERGVRSIGICYLFSFLNPEHERETEAIVEAEFPEVFTSRSSAVIPKIREYPRLSTTAIDAYVGPELDAYLTDLLAALRSTGLRTDQVYFMLSHGGLVPVESATDTPCRSVLSGPAAGVKGGAYFAGKVGLEDVITMDMGGTSCDISIVRGGEPTETQRGEIDGQPLAFPMVEISTIGAGGGTEARVENGRLKVGPTSAGADPGPICYDRGGTVPTVTDANVILGRLNPDHLLGGEIDVAADRARDAVESLVADPLSLDVVEAASHVLEIVNDKMKKEIRLQLSEYGLDPRSFSLVSYGGAGPTHVGSVAAKLGIERVVIPPRPGINSAIGLLCTDIEQEYLRSRVAALQETDPAALAAAFDELAAEAIADRQAEGFDESEVSITRRLDLRYEGQGYELTVDVDDTGTDAGAIRERFDETHRSRYGHSSTEPVETVNYRVVSTVPVDDLALDPPSGAADPEPTTTRPVHHPATGETIETPIYRREDLGPAARVPGPAIVEQLDTTTVVEPHSEARVDDRGSLILEVDQ